MSEKIQSSIAEGDWVYAEPHRGAGKVIEKSSLWGTDTFRVWFPSTDTVVRLRPEQVSTQSTALDCCIFINKPWSEDRVKRYRQIERARVILWCSKLPFLPPLQFYKEIREQNQHRFPILSYLYLDLPLPS